MLCSARHTHACPGARSLATELMSIRDAPCRPVWINVSFGEIASVAIDWDERPINATVMRGCDQGEHPCQGKDSPVFTQGVMACSDGKAPACRPQSQPHQAGPAGISARPTPTPGTATAGEPRRTAVQKPTTGGTGAKQGKVPPQDCQVGQLPCSSEGNPSGQPPKCADGTPPACKPARQRRGPPQDCKQGEDPCSEGRPSGTPPLCANGNRPACRPILQQGGQPAADIGATGSTVGTGGTGGPGPTQPKSTAHASATEPHQPPQQPATVTNASAPQHPKQPQQQPTAVAAANGTRAAAQSRAHNPPAQKMAKVLTTPPKRNFQAVVDPPASYANPLWCIHAPLALWCIVYTYPLL